MLKTWTHGIARRQQDIYDSVVYPRERRVSVTFRKVIVDVYTSASGEGVAKR